MSVDHKQEVRKAMQALESLHNIAKEAKAVNSLGEYDVIRAALLHSPALQEPAAPVKAEPYAWEWHTPNRNGTWQPHLGYQRPTGGVGYSHVRPLYLHSSPQAEAAVSASPEMLDVPFPPLPLPVIKHPKLGHLYDRMAMHMYAMEYADLCADAALSAAPAEGARTDAEWLDEAMTLAENYARARQHDAAGSFMVKKQADMAKAALRKFIEGRRQRAPQRPPDGYAYEYPGPYGGIMFTNGEERNGSKPLRAIPYFFSTPVKELYMTAKVKVTISNAENDEVLEQLIVNEYEGFEANMPVTLAKQVVEVIEINFATQEA